ncbi:Tetratricopeptide-like helical domain superfamily [Sesbania bispinosa]|nr:Tetratricopeptide-like helical domain superfamily [Sesbania bispinosa]
MAQAYPFGYSPSSVFHGRKSITFSYSCNNLIAPQSKAFCSLQDRFPELSQALTSLQDSTKLEVPHSKSSRDAVSSPVKLAKSLNSCHPSEQHVFEILKGLGHKVTERDAVVILDNTKNPETALFAVKYYLQHKGFRNIRGLDRAEKLFGKMLQRGIKPSLVTFSTIIQCAIMCHLPHKAVEWFEKMPSFGCEPDENLCSSMIYACSRARYDTMALSLYDRVRTKKWHLDTAAFSALIKIYAKSQDYDGCLRVYNDMKVLGVEPDMETYNNLLFAMGKAKLGFKAKAIYEDMMNNGYIPNPRTYYSLLKAYCRGRLCEDAVNLYKVMKKKCISMDAVHYSMLFDTADVGYEDEVAEMFQDMKSSRTCQPDGVAYASVVSMYSRMGKVSEAEGALNEMIQCGFKPNILLMTSLVHCYGKAKRTDDVVKKVNQLLDFGISPDDRFCDCLLYVMIKIPNEELGKITDCVEKANPKLGSVVRYLMEEQEGDDGDFRKEASELLNSIGNDVRRGLCSCLIHLCVKLGVPDRARDLLNLGLTLGIYRDIQSKSKTKWCLHLKYLSLGVALTGLHVWINDLSKAAGDELPPLLGIDIGLGKDKSSDKGLVLANIFESYLRELNAPFRKGVLTIALPL